MRTLVCLFFSSFASHLCSFSSFSSSSFLFPSPISPKLLLYYSSFLPHYPAVPFFLLFHQPLFLLFLLLLLTSPISLTSLLSSLPLLPCLLKATCWATWVTHSSRRASWAVRSMAASSTSAPPSSRCRTCCCPTRLTSSASWYRSGKRHGPRSSPSASCCG